jgi:hypothetical protein
MLMSACAVLQQHSQPVDADINEISNICVCGTYQRIRAASSRVTWRVVTSLPSGHTRGIAIAEAFGTVVAVGRRNLGRHRDIAERRQDGMCCRLWGSHQP